MVDGQTVEAPRTILDEAEEIDPSLWASDAVEVATLAAKGEYQPTPEIPRVDLNEYVLRAGDVISGMRTINVAKPQQPRPNLWSVDGLKELITGKAAVEQGSKTNARDLIMQEIAVNEYIFGSFDPRYKPEFFLLESDGRQGATWVESQYSDNDQQVISRYEYRGNGFKLSVDGGPYRELTDGEMTEFYTYVRQYYETSMKRVYRRDPATAQPLSVEDSLYQAA